MTEKKIGCCFFVDKNDVLIGILTDGDIRRLLIKNNIILKITLNEINQQFYFTEDLEKYIFEIEKYNYIPILNSKKIIGIISKLQ